MSKQVLVLLLVALLLTLVGTKMGVQSSFAGARPNYGNERERSKTTGKCVINAQTSRGLWVWGTDVVTDPTAQSEFLDFIQRKDITSIYLHAYFLLPDEANQTKDFIAKAEAVGAEVELLSGDPTWALTPNHAIALDFVQQVITFTESITGDAGRPVGAHLDIEPYVLSQWNSSSDIIIPQYLDLLNSVRQELATSTVPLTFTVDIPFWFDTITLTYKSATKPLNQHVQDLVDRVVIMDYRDFAEGGDGIIYHARNEMDYARSISKEVVIGIETNEVEPEKITFFEEGETVMEEELAIVEQYYQTNAAFHGFAIHDYVGYQALSSDCVYLPAILK